jgi:hypothetical protein
MDREVDAPERQCVGRGRVTALLRGMRRRVGPRRALRWARRCRDAALPGAAPGRAAGAQAPAWARGARPQRPAAARLPGKPSAGAHHPTRARQALPQRAAARLPVPGNCAAVLPYPAPAPGPALAARASSTASVPRPADPCRERAWERLAAALTGRRGAGGQHGVRARRRAAGARRVRAGAPECGHARLDGGPARRAHPGVPGRPPRGRVGAGLLERCAPSLANPPQQPAVPASRAFPVSSRAVNLDLSNGERGATTTESLKACIVGPRASIGRRRGRTGAGPPDKGGPACLWAAGAACECARAGGSRRRLSFPVVPAGLLTTWHAAAEDERRCDCRL